MWARRIQRRDWESYERNRSKRKEWRKRKVKGGKRRIKENEDGIGEGKAKKEEKGRQR
jgi:hypothetical protein